MSAPSVVAGLDEPIGIVISRGKRDEPTPAFSAYVWGPASDDPEPTVEPVES